MIRFIIYFLLTSILSTQLSATLNPSLQYYLPDVEYDPNIPTPKDFFGFEIGEWHVSHDRMIQYMSLLAEKSDRVNMKEYGRTYEQRPLVHLEISSSGNIKNIDEIQRQHRRISDPAEEDLNFSEHPVVLYHAYGVHGNEASATNAAILVAYYLAAAQSDELAVMLEQMVVILDPCLNPDGYNRFTTWVNMNRNKNLTFDSNDREFSESWPGGRTNHYWFDLNRDYLVAQHPESAGRIDLFHRWKPNVYTDFHEMGSNSSYFFMPGIPERTFPVTPLRNQELTEAISLYHAEALDQIGSLYYSKESFDDFYIGKGSTFPDLNGCIGILFEQASSRGHAQETDNGLLTFAFAIRNQVATSLSSQKASYEMREELLQFQNTFYKDGIRAAGRYGSSGFVFGDKYDLSRSHLLVEILNRHEIDVYEVEQDITVNKKEFLQGKSFFVPLNQPQFHLIRGIFETFTEFKDSIFYDVSSWTLPLAFGLDYERLDNSFTNLTDKKIQFSGKFEAAYLTKSSNYGYLMSWDDYFAPKALNMLLQKDLRLKMANEDFELGGVEYSKGAIFIPVGIQDISSEDLFEIIKNVSITCHIKINSISTGQSDVGSSLGSGSFSNLRKPSVMLVVGSGVSSYSAGEIWHQLDQRYEMVVTKVEQDRIARVDLEKYNTILLPEGYYSDINSETVEKLKDWLRNGGTLIAIGRGAEWASSQKLINIEKPAPEVKKEDQEVERKAYNQYSKERGGKFLGGAIIQAEIDLSHPLFYGYHHESLPVFRRGAGFWKPGKNPYSTPMIYSEDPLLSGYIHRETLKEIPGAAGLIVGNMGSGRVIALADNPVFRAYWIGGNKMLANAIFFGHTINRGTTEN